MGSHRLARSWLAVMRSQRLARSWLAVMRSHPLARCCLVLLCLQEARAADISLETICGNKLVDSCPTKISLKVIGGASSCAEAVPWNVLVEHATSTNKAVGGGVYPYCGGVLVTEQHVLSAAHCFWTNENQFGTCPKQYLVYNYAACKREGCPASCSRLGPEDVLLYLGVTDRTKARKVDGRAVSSIVMHPGWDRTKHLNDILSGHDLALLRMERGVDMYSRTTVPVCLPNPRDDYLLQARSSADISGFGVVIEPVSGALQHPTKLQTARVELTSTSTCQGWWNTKGKQICAVGTQKIESSSGLELVADSCNGDSGGGLTANNFNGREVLLGIVSFGETDCGRRGGKPGVYTNVLDHMDWIQEQIGGRDGRPPLPSSVLGSQGIQCVASNGKQCKFPFKFRNKMFASCTSDFDPENRPWCSTEVNGAGEHVEFGYCTPSCPVDILSTPSPPVLPSTTPAPAPSPWSQWSSCSATCGRGTKQRSRPCPGSTSPGCTRQQSQGCGGRACREAATREWAAWGACSKTCGGGTQTRTQVGNNVAQTQGCSIQGCSENFSTGQGRARCRLSRSEYDLGNDFLSWSVVRSLEQCQQNCLDNQRCAGITWVRSGRRNCALYDTSGARDGEATSGQDSYSCAGAAAPQNSGSTTSLPSSSGSSSSSTISWLVGGGDRFGSSVETLGSSSAGLCGTQLPDLPASRASMSGGYLGGQVVACGGSTGGRGQTGVHNDCWATSTSSPSWRQIASMPTNTSNAASAVAGGRLYVAGGYTQPLCGYRPEVNVYSPSSGWSALVLDPPKRVGAYACAVAIGAQIFFIGGWYPPSVYTSSCREDRYEGAELTRVNREQSYYHDQVQVLDTATGRWRDGPRLRQRRRNHGCTATQVGGRQGIIVAGGYNPDDSKLSSVEYLDLGTDVSNLRLDGARWRDLPAMGRARQDRLVLFAASNKVFAVGGDREGGVEEMDLTQPGWRSISSGAHRKRKYTLAIPGVPSSGGVC